MIKSRRLRWAGHVARMEEGCSAFRNLNKSTRKGPLGSLRCTLENDIRLDLKRNIFHWEELDRFGSEWRLLESRCEYGIEHLYFKSHEDS